jgi:hypothetical protein
MVWPGGRMVAVHHRSLLAAPLVARRLGLRCNDHILNLIMHLPDQVGCTLCAATVQRFVYTGGV